MKKITKLIIFILLLASFLNIIKVLWLTYLPDFNVYYSSAKSALQQGNPYLVKGIFIDGFLYPPFCLLLFYPFVLLPIAIASKLWSFLSIVFLLVSIWFLAKLYEEQNNRLLLACFGILAFIFFPVKFTLGMGQLNIITLFIITLSLYFYKKKKNKKAGILYAFSLMIKYFPLVIIPYLFLRKQWNTLFGFGLTFVILIIFGIIVVGSSINIYYIKHILPSLSTAADSPYYYNQALTGFLSRDLTQLPISQLIIVRIIVALFFLISTGWIMLKKGKKKQINMNLEVGIVITLSLLLNSFSWQHHFTLLLIPLIVTFFVIKQNKLSWKFYGILAVCYLLTATNAAKPTQLPVLLQSHVFYGAVMLWIVDLYLLYRY